MLHKWFILEFRPDLDRWLLRKARAPIDDEPFVPLDGLMTSLQFFGRPKSSALPKAVKTEIKKTARIRHDIQWRTRLDKSGSSVTGWDVWWEV